MIKEAFLNVDILGPHVRDGHYDLLGPNGEVIPPSAWEHVVEPGVTITMHMWSLEKTLARMSHNGVPFLPNPGREQNQQEVPHPKPQVEVDKAPAGSQRDKGRPREDKRHRKHRRIPIFASWGYPIADTPRTKESGLESEVGRAQRPTPRRH
jgi:hypothetical protein